MRPLWKGCEGCSDSPSGNAERGKWGKIEAWPGRAGPLLHHRACRLASLPSLQRDSRDRGASIRTWRGRKNGKWSNRQHVHLSLPLQLPVLCRPAACFGLKKCPPFLPLQRNKKTIVSISSRFRPCPPLPSRPPGHPSHHRVDETEKQKTDSPFASNIQSITLRRAPATNRRLLRPSICCPFAPLRITATAITVGDSSLCARVLCSTPLPGARVHRRTARQRPATRCCCCCMLHDSATNQRP